MTVPTTSLPSLGQWRLLARLLIRSPIGSECRADRMVDRADCTRDDLGELVEEGWVAGYNSHGDNVDDLMERWPDHLDHIRLRITPKGSAWMAGNPHTRLLFEIADAQGAYRMKPAEVKDQDEVLQHLAGRRLITIENDAGESFAGGSVRTFLTRTEGPLHIRLTERGRSIVSP